MTRVARDFLGLGRACAILALLLLFSSSCLRAEVLLPSIFSDHMVLQAGKPAAIWGKATPGEKIAISFANHSYAAQAGSDGAWSTKLDPVAKGGPYELVVRGGNVITIHDVLVGEVWLGSGQSNMEMQIRGLHGAVDNADREIAAANYPQIRMFLFDETYDIRKPDAPGDRPASDRPGHWVICSPATVAKFSAIGYFFSRELHQQLATPVGFIHSSVGGTPIEAWTSLAAQQKQPGLRPVLAHWQQQLAGYDPVQDQQRARAARDDWRAGGGAAGAEDGYGAPGPARKPPPAFRNRLVSTPGGLFNAMIAPLIPYTIQGVVWYQGEQNGLPPLSHLYGVQLETLIRDWRARWNDPFYFAWVQIPAFRTPQNAPSEDRGWGVYVRDGQRQALELPNTGMAVTIDYGGPNAGHPTNKADFAHRVALLALHDVYRKPIAVWSGPIFKSATRRGNAIVLSFDHAQGLHAANGRLDGFGIADGSRQFVWADARIENDQVIVSGQGIADPAAVRYGWSANPIGNLVNGGGLPASPFRTDSWE